jgi:hypothetical protein
MDDRASKGGKARAAALTPEQRSEAARRAVQSRWRKATKASVAVSFSQPVERSETTTHEVAYGTPSPTAEVSAWSASSPSFVISLNKTESSTQ